LLAQPAPAEAGVVGILNVYVGAVPRTARNVRRVQRNNLKVTWHALHCRLGIIIDLEMELNLKSYSLSTTSLSLPLSTSSKNSSPSGADKSTALRQFLILVS